MRDVDRKEKNTSHAIVIEYQFQLEDDQIDTYRFEIDAANLQIVKAGEVELPRWTELGLHQCPNCPLDPVQIAVCPAAANMVRLVARFDQLLSFDKANVSVITAKRMICSDTTVQHGVCSLMGLLMASSGCPLTAFFKPMARFHMPFTSTEETIWRATTTYVLAQYFLYREGGQPDLQFKGLSRLYKDIQIVNSAFARRLRSACRQDCLVNAIILLDMFAKSMPAAIEESLQQLRGFFSPMLSGLDSADDDTTKKIDLKKDHDLDSIN